MISPIKLKVLAFNLLDMVLKDDSKQSFQEMGPCTKKKKANSLDASNQRRLRNRP